MARPRVFRLPMFVIAAALLGLIALLATLQYRWLGQISDAERQRMTATLNDRAKAFGEDVDRELTRAYLLFQIDLPGSAGQPAQELATRYDRWQATARFPRLIKDIYLVVPERADDPRPLERYDPATRATEPLPLPSALAPVRAEIVRSQIPQHVSTPSGGSAAILYRTLTPIVWASVPALVIPSPVVLVNHDLRVVPDGGPDPSTFMKETGVRHTVLLLDGEYISRDMLPALTAQHFGDAGDRVKYRVAVVPSSGTNIPIYHSESGSALVRDSAADAQVDLFQVRVQDFSTVASEISRFATVSGAARIERNARTQFSIVVQDSRRGSAGLDKLVMGAAAANIGASVTTRLGPTGAGWRLLVQHPSGSLESAVNAVRRRNLAISSSVLGILGLSLAFLIVSTRRAHDLARQQLEFVATVSHELRTPLAVIRSAADNLADGIVHDELHVRQYGELVRREGVRLTDLVEQILEFAGLQSGQRSLARRPVEIDGVLREVAAAAQEAARDRLTIDLAVADRLPAVAGDAAALRRVFQNLIGNAVKYGAGAGWVGVEAIVDVSRVVVTVRDRGIGIAPADQDRIFDPFYRSADVVSAQIQGAGLGLSLVKRIVDAHGGRITVESAPGKGSAFIVTLPTASGDAAEGPVGEAAAQHS
ncbi:MAG TPA: HAMP domain-containing sensor histidine kinase [Vicinamibacterales bacterium]|jgi:signal transduction histidine kinase|nr:HAMP domain-containing sensor histidine kinase [Vicinamibacterales bacterium]